MSIFSKLFKSKDKENGYGKSLVDEDLGEFNPLTKSSSNDIWTRVEVIDGFQIEIFIDGINSVLNKSSKDKFQEIKTSFKDYLLKSEIALKKECENADIHFENWQEVFNIESISIRDGEVEMSFEQKKSFCHFNVHFEQEEEYISIDC